MREITDIPENKKISVVIFGSNWCASCKRATIFLEEAEKENHNIDFLKIDVDNASNELLDEFNINELPVIIAYKNGKEKSRYREQDGTLASWCKFIQW